MLNAVTDVIVLGDLPDLQSLGARRAEPAPGDAPLAARVCAEITRLTPTPPLLIVTVGEYCALLPAIALAQRAARRRVVGYVLIDPDYPAVSESWPDARVHVLGTSESNLRTASLRGWETGPASGLHDLVREIVLSE